MSGFLSVLIPVLIVVAIGFIVGLGLALAAKFMAVETDETEAKIRECLPGANCGACGYSGCDGYAAALAKGEASPDKCAPGGATAAAALSEVLGVEIETNPKVAFIACAGNREITDSKYAYSGMMSCSAANLLHAGPVSCEFGCIGYGDCMKACEFGAITNENGKMTVCKDVCVGCGKCTKVCPKGIISLIPKDSSPVVVCSNKKKGAAVVKVCKNSCIACMMCEKNCPSGAIKVIDNVAQIDYSICTSCGKCKEVCKRNAII